MRFSWLTSSTPPKRGIFYISSVYNLKIYNSLHKVSMSSAKIHLLFRSAAIPPALMPEPPKLLDKDRNKIRLKHYSIRMKQCLL